MEPIYFWKIKRLKYELASSRQSARHTLVYLACILGIQIGLRMLAHFIGEPPSLWDHLDLGVFLFLLGTGGVYCFFANGGKSGRDFISRYISLAWVFGVRFAVMVELPLTFCLYDIPSIFIEMPVQTQWYDVVLSMTLRLTFYFFLARHIQDVAHGRVPNREELLDFRDKHSEDFDPAVYPSPLRRYVSTVIDAALVFTACIVLSYIIRDGISGIEAGLAAAVLFSYEPILTSWSCTLGQRMAGIRVRTLDSKERISIFNAYKRSAVKLLLGFISLFLIPATRKRRAIHDFAAGTVVVYSKTMEEHNG